MSVGPIVKRELRSSFNSPIAYLVIVVFLVLGSVWFLSVQRFLFQNVASLRGYFDLVPILYIVFVPALTMRIWAEERRSGTLELLVTLPLRDSELVLGKFGAAYTLIVVFTVLTIPLALALAPLGHFDPGQIAGEYLGMLLLGAAATAIGGFVSALASNQISAFIGSFVLLLALTLVGGINSYIDLPVWLAAALNYASFTYHFQGFAKGLLDTRDVVYFVLVTLLFLYLTAMRLSFRKLR